jgi:mannose-6-phosphate isomerase-like protein (cupin superfamily)
LKVAAELFAPQGTMRHPMTMHKVNIAEKFSQITEYWKPYVGAELNGQMVKFDKLKGEFVFHHHENEDEMFLVVKGRFRMEFRDPDGKDRTNGSKRVSSSSSRAASSTSRLPTKNAGSSSSSQPPL